VAAVLSGSLARGAVQLIVFGRAARAPTQRRKFVGSCPGFVDDWRENAGPTAFWPSTGRGRVWTVASTCQDRHFDGGGGLREPPHPRTGLVPTTRGIRSRLAQASSGATARPSDAA